MGGSSGGGGGGKVLPAGLGASTPNLFNAAQKYMPPGYFGSQPNSNPSGILNAYMQNMPAFMNAAKSVNYSATPTPVQTTPGVQTAETPAAKGTTAHTAAADAFWTKFVNSISKKGTQ